MDRLSPRFEAKFSQVISPFNEVDTSTDDSTKRVSFSHNVLVEEKGAMHIFMEMYDTSPVTGAVRPSPRTVTVKVVWSSNTT